MTDFWHKFKEVELNTSLNRNLLNTFQSLRNSSTVSKSLWERARLQFGYVQGSCSMLASATVDRLEHLPAHLGSHLEAIPHHGPHLPAATTSFWSGNKLSTKEKVMSRHYRPEIRPCGTGWTCHPSMSVHILESVQNESEFWLCHILPILVKLLNLFRSQFLHL